MVAKRTWWILGFSMVAAALQFVLVAYAPTGRVVYLLMVLSLYPFNQAVIPTLKTSDGWPVPTHAGFVLYALLSVAVIFLLTSGVAFLLHSRGRRNAP